MTSSPSLRFSRFFSRIPRFFLIPLLVMAASCAGPTVRVSSRFNPNRIKSVAVLEFEDAYNYKGSGSSVSQVFASELISQGFRVIERDRLQQVMAEQKLSARGPQDRKSMKDLASALQVDAFITGAITSFTPEQRTTTWVRESETNTTVSGSTSTYRNRQKRTRETYMPLSSYEGAQLALISRMVDVGTGEVLWVGNYYANGENLQDAAEYISREIIRKVVKESQKRK